MAGTSGGYPAAMEVRIEEGRLVETGSERRAFGEFVGPHGELASYAFGWAAGADTRLTIGIPAGTFHAGVSADEDGYAFSLLDEPFERVPQGGPDLTAGAGARARGPAVRVAGRG